jgi:hypothetical protein
MTVSVILNLSPQALAAGRLAGSAEIVRTGERRLVRDAAELVAFLVTEGTGPDPRTEAHDDDAGG